jgi:ubiquinone/menaquinone biosynthesis C-methylase UbiE
VNIHEAAAKGFERGAAEYEKGRPGYPQELVDRFVELSGLGPGKVVVDIGAGTGKFTRMLVPTGATVIAVEPVAAMRAQLAESVPGVEILDGTSESLPLPDASADVVTAAQAAHWFEGRAAFADIARVLGPGGTVGLVWNTRDKAWPWTEPIDELMARVAGDAPRFRQADDRWTTALAANDDFDEVRLEEFTNAATHDLDSMLARVSSVSYVSALPDDRRAALLDELTTILREGPMAAAEGDTFVEPYRTELYWCRRR